jgi:transcriptional regulator with XRE-family HTH domain
MDDLRVGRQLRALRRRCGWRQRDIAERAGISQPAVSRIERGRLDGVPLERIRSVAKALDADLSVVVRWRAGELDRLMDEDHAGGVGTVAGWLARRDWEPHSEVTYSIYGERGSIDILAWHAPTRTVLVVEVKTELTSVEETLRRHDAKTRLAGRIGAERFGWQPRNVARLLTFPDRSTARRRVERDAAVLDRAYPIRGRAVRDWIRAPTGAPSCLAFLAVEKPARAGPRRVRRPRPTPTESRC